MTNLKHIFCGGFRSYILKCASCRISMEFRRPQEPVKNGLFREIGRFVLFCFVLFFESWISQTLGFKLKQNHNHTSRLWGRVHVHPGLPSSSISTLALSIIQLFSEIAVNNYLLEWRFVTAAECFRFPKHFIVCTM